MATTTTKFIMKGGWAVGWWFCVLTLVPSSVWRKRPKDVWPSFLHRIPTRKRLYVCPTQSFWVGQTYRRWLWGGHTYRRLLVGILRWAWTTARRPLAVFKLKTAHNFHKFHNSPNQKSLWSIEWWHWLIVFRDLYFSGSHRTFSPTCITHSLNAVRKHRMLVFFLDMF